MSPISVEVVRTCSFDFVVFENFNPITFIITSHDSILCVQKIAHTPMKKNNRYIIREVARSMARAKPPILSIQNGTVSLVSTFQAVRDVPLSSRVNKMIGAEIDNVELQGQIVLKMLAVAMKPCSKDLIYASYPLVHHRDYVSDALDDLMERNLVTNVRGGVFFTSPFVFHVVRQRLVEMLRVEIRSRLDQGAELVKSGSVKMPEDSASDLLRSGWGFEAIQAREMKRRETRQSMIESMSVSRGSVSTKEEDTDDSGAPSRSRVDTNVSLNYDTSNHGTCCLLFEREAREFQSSHFLVSILSLFSFQSSHFLVSILSLSRFNPLTFSFRSSHFSRFNPLTFSFQSSHFSRFNPLTFLVSILSLFSFQSSHFLVSILSLSRSLARDKYSHSRIPSLKHRYRVGW